MDHRETLRALAAAVAPDQGVTVPAAWLLAALDSAPAAPPDPIEVDLTVEQLALRFGRAPSTVRGWLERGDFPAAYRRAGREWRVPPAAVLAYQEHQRATAPRASGGAVDIGAWRQHLRRPAA